MEKVIGTIENVIFYSPSNHYCVCEFDANGELITMQGTIINPNPGDPLEVDGEWTVHPKYGRQFKIKNVNYDVQLSSDGVFAFLSSGALRGIGEKKALLLMETFGDRVIDVIRDDPEKLTEVKGISLVGAMNIHQDYMERYADKQVIIDLYAMGLSTNLVTKLYSIYGSTAARVVQNDPYTLIKNVRGIGFNKADQIALANGMDRMSTSRIQAAISYYLDLVASRGDTLVSVDDLIDAVSNGISVPSGLVVDNVVRMSDFGSCDRIKIKDKTYLMKTLYANIERDIAARLKFLDKFGAYVDINKATSLVEDFSSKSSVKLNDEQKNAVTMALSNRISIITGGPGTGKTTIINALTSLLRTLGLKYALCAPTGRAAKRMSEACSDDASTIHRLLGYAFNENSSEEDSLFNFTKDEDDPLEEEYIIVDESSMLDITLFDALLKAISSRSCLVMVGDCDQLPPVGVGNVLNDVLTSDQFASTRLKTVYRQANGGDIVTNAHRINEAKKPIYTSEDGDFFINDIQGSGVIASRVLDIIKNNEYGFFDLLKDQKAMILSPFRKGDTGTDSLNEKVRDLVNPKTVDSVEWKIGETLFRTGDKVMQIRNNYSLKGRNEITREEKEGVFNGDMGIIEQIDISSKTIYVLFEDMNLVGYSFEEAQDLKHSYVITVHKSQGSEYPVVMLVVTGSNPMFMTRNLLYTAVTRAKKKVMIIGPRYVVDSMVSNKSQIVRHTTLKMRLCEEL